MRDIAREPPTNILRFPTIPLKCTGRTKRHRADVPSLDEPETIMKPLHSDTASRTRYRWVGAAWALGGAAWLAGGLIAGGTYEAIWIVADLLLLSALAGLARLAPHGDGRLGRAGLAAATAGRVAFVAAEAIAAATGNDENPLLPIGALLTAVGMTAFGIAVLRARRWRGPARLAPLAMGVYPFVTMFPYVIASGGDPSVAAIAWWALPTVCVGIAVWAGSPTNATAVTAAPAV